MTKTPVDCELRHATVYFNGACPVCSFEVGRYIRSAEAAAAPLSWVDISQSENATALSPYGLTCDDAYRRMTALVDGEEKPDLGVDAFIIIWERLPKLRWVAKLFRWPVVRPISAFLYEHVAALIIYKWTQRRLRRAAHNTG